jgi:hypothetical protein
MKTSIDGRRINIVQITKEKLGFNRDIVCVRSTCYERKHDKACD